MDKSKPHFEVAAGLIIRRGKILITQRPAGSHMAGLWEFPGGKRERGETLRECLERELREELGITIKAGRLLAKVEHEYDSRSISLYLFQCSPPDREPIPIGCESIAWLGFEQLGDYPMPPADKELISLVRSLKNGLDQ